MAKPTYESELGRLGRKVAEAQARIDAVRPELDGRLAYWHEQGVSIAALARASGLSRQGVYNALERGRAAAGERAHRPRRPPTGSSGTSLPAPRRRRRG